MALDVLSSAGLASASPLAGGTLPRVASSGAVEAMKRSKTLAMLGVSDDAEAEEAAAMLEKEGALLIPSRLDTEECSSIDLQSMLRIHRQAKDVEDAKSPRATVTTKAKSDKAAGSDDDKAGATKAASTFYQLVFDIQACIFKAHNETLCLFSLYDHKKGEYISEEYTLHLTPTMFPTKGLIDECKVVFRDITEELIKTADLYIVARIYRIGPMEAPDPSAKEKKTGGLFSRGKGKSEDLKLTRPFAATVIPLRKAFGDLKANEGISIDFEPSTAPVMCPSDELAFSTLPVDLITGDAKAGAKLAPMSLGIAYSLTLFKGSIESAVPRYEHREFLTHIHLLKVNPLCETTRHKLYVKLKDIHVQQRKKKAPCNVKVCVELRNDSYQPMECIRLGCGPMAMPGLTFESPVYYHTNDPVIDQTLIVDIPKDIKELEKCHLYFSLFHQPAHSEKGDTRGFAYLPLMNSSGRALCSSKGYALEVYKEDSKKEVPYLTDPALRSDAKQINIRFTLASTRVLPDSDIHTFLTWKSQSAKHLVDAVKRVSKKSFDELMKILNEFMESIFAIMRNTREDTLLEETFFALVGVLGEVNNTINIRYKGRVESWIRQKFNHPTVWRTIGDQQLRLLRWIASEDAVKASQKGAPAELVRQSSIIVKHLSKAMRGVQYLFQLMKKSMECEMRSSPEAKKKVASEYATMTRQLFEAMNKLMTLEKPQLVKGVQSYALRGFVSLLDGLTTRDSKVLINLAIKFLKSAQKGGVHNNVEKLLLLKRLIEHPKLSRADIVNVLLPNVTPMLINHLSLSAESMDERLAAAMIVKSCVPLLTPGRARVVSIDPSDLVPSDDSKDDGEVEELRKGMHEAADEIGAESPFKYVADYDKTTKVPTGLLDSFVLILLRMVAVLHDARNTDLTEVTNASRIFNRTLTKNPSRPRAQSVPTRGDVSEDQLIVHRDLLAITADLARAVTQHGGEAGSWAATSDRVINALSMMKAEEVKRDAAMSPPPGDEDVKLDVAASIVSKMDAKLQKDSIECLIATVLECCSNLLRSSLYPSGWIFMRMVEAELGMRALAWFGSSLKKSYLGVRFNRELWAQWLTLGMAYLANRDFALEDMEEDRSDVISTNFGDIRQMAIKMLTTAWEQLTPHRSHLADIMVRSAVEASASDVPEIQEFAVEVFYQMMRSEFEQKSDLKTVETHTIDQIDFLTAQYSQQPTIVNRYLDFFRVRVRNALRASSSKLRKSGEQFIDEIESLYDYLVQLRSLPSDKDHEDERTAVTLELLLYLRRIDKDHMYNRYLHHLALMHVTLKNNTEAAICFYEHAQRLGYSDEPLRSEPQISLAPDLEWKRHISLLEKAHQYFLAGESWEMGLRVCAELQRAYEHELWQIQKLPATLQKQAQMWTLINSGVRVFQACYLVQFRGKTFEDRIRNQNFIFKSGDGKMPEGVREFTERIKKKYPGAEVVNSPNPIPPEKDTSTFDGSYIQITTLSASSEDEMNGEEFKWAKAPLPLRSYHRENETAIYTYTFQDRSKRIKGENEFRSVWITRMYLVAEETIPCRRRRVPVARIKPVEYTPLHTAVNSLAEKNKQVYALVEEVEKDPGHNPNTLSMCLNGILDAAVMGGVDKYREAFFDGIYFERHPLDKPRGDDFKRVLREQMEAAAYGLQCYSKYADTSLEAHVTHLSDCLSKMKRDLHEFLKDK